MNQHDIQALHRLIDDFFEARTSLDDEMLLRRLLASPELPADDPIIAQARAVVGWTSLQRPAPVMPAPRQAIRKRPRWPIFAAAAVVAAIIASAAAFFIASPGADGALPQGSAAVVYAQGRTIHDTDLALSNMHAQLAEIGGADLTSPADPLESLHEFDDIFN